MMSRVTLQAAFVLHHKPFRDTSVIADLITPNHGRVSVIARGARSPKSRRRALLQPFRPLLASWTGRSELMTLTTLEESGPPKTLTNESLACAYYVTELALRLLASDEPNVGAFALYARTLSALSESSTADAAIREACLRVFELDLLESLGLLPDLAHCDQAYGLIEAGRQYQYQPESGTATRAEISQYSVKVSGATLLALSLREFTAETRLEAKHVMRAVLQVHLGGWPLKSREVFRQLRALSAPVRD